MTEPGEQQCDTEDLIVELVGPLFEPLADRTNKVEGDLEAHTEILKSITEQLEKLSKDDGEKKPAPWNLYDGNPGKLAEILGEIQKWIPWFNRTYGFPRKASMIPPCWYLHPRLLPEIVGLYVSWKAANYGTSVPNSDLVYWNLRYLPDVMRICQDSYFGWSACNSTNHIEPVKIDPVPEMDSESFAAWLDKEYLSKATATDAAAEENESGLPSDDPYADVPPPPEPDFEPGHEEVPAAR